MAFARRTGRAFSALALAAGVAFGAVLVVPALAGWQRYVIVTGSMTGTYDRGSLVLDDVVPVASLERGDVITYRPPRESGVDHLVTHRIYGIARGPHGQQVFRTKGDANPVPDPWTFTLGGPRQARVRAGVPYVGFAVSLLSDRRARMLLVGLPAALIALASLAGLWRESGESADADSRRVRLAPNSRRDETPA
jgi:signal peptidase I